MKRVPHASYIGGGLEVRKVTFQYHDYFLFASDYLSLRPLSYDTLGVRFFLSSERK